MIKKVETWRWRNRDPKALRARRRAPTGDAQDAANASPETERAPASAVREPHDDFADTVPRVFRPDEPE